MCEYCSDLNAISLKNPIVDFELNMGDLGRSYMGIYIRHKMSDKGYKVSCLDLCMTSHNIGADTIRRLKRIYYCPICGRYLKEEDKND
ncbi:MAG: hypothetical protein J6O61_01575 [Butyrivibrio sp.]|jgi:hypothetical protein|uniref:hypothetical protein n=1 Tax=Butyrivibrio sp. TaxID=28121 RepID=UPI001B0ADC75|nr:hypothetical protein [Butyrivibrio sp.]MBO6239524.1 hypothetical protein [Butyrivibrio sp.]